MVNVDQNKCIGCGACVAICSDMFEMGGNGKSHVKNQKAKCNVKEAIDSCPVGAIKA